MNKIYKVTLTQTVTKIVEVRADNDHDAQALAAGAIMLGYQVPAVKETVSSKGDWVISEVREQKPVQRGLVPDVQSVSGFSKITDPEYPYQEEGLSVPRLGINRHGGDID